MNQVYLLNLAKKVNVNEPIAPFPNTLTANEVELKMPASFLASI